MCHCLEEGGKGGKDYNSQSKNGSNQESMELSQWSLVYGGSSSSLVKSLSSSNHIILLGRVDQLFAIDVERLGI